MITDFIIQGTLGIFLALFTAFPDLPAMPQMIVDGWNWFLTATNSATGLLVYFLSPPLYILAIGLIIFMTTFHYIYHFFVRFVIMTIFFRIMGK